MNLEQLFTQHFPGYNFLFNYSLQNKSYFKIGGPAEVFFAAKKAQEAIDLLVFCKEKDIRFTIIGGASNVVIADEGISGLVLSLDFADFSVISETDQDLLIRAEAGIKTANLVGKAAALGGSGLEGFIGVPGVLGGAIYNNAHYLKALISDVIVEVEAFDLESNNIINISREKCEFAYEQSIFQKNKNFIIFSATFALKKISPEQVKQLVRDSIAKREKTQPLDLPSCGCVFQNPANTDGLRQLFPQFAQLEFVPAGFLIEAAGLKGIKEGDIQVSEKHAAFFVNLSHGTAKDVVKLVEKVKAVVLEKFGVILKEEIFYLK